MSIHPSQLAITDFTYDLPDDRIARYPLPVRDQSKLLIYKNGEISEDIFKTLPTHLPGESLLVFNNTRVINARILFKTDIGQTIEVFCLNPSHNGELGQSLASVKQVAWDCLVGNLRKWKQGELSLNAGDLELKARLLKRNDSYQEILFHWQPPELSFAEVLEKTGNIPIPPYLNRDSDQTDQDNYQTIYAKEKGSVAAPTAGLHFTPEVFKNLGQRGIDCLDVTLHVGAGTFRPVKSLTMEGHSMHREWLDVDVDCIVKLCKNAGKNIFAVGTTSLRTMETLYWMGVKAYNNPAMELESLQITQWEVYEPQSTLTAQQSLESLVLWLEKRSLKKLVCQTQILIAPPYRLRLCRGLITNFHQPASTLLLLVSAITGADWKKIYQYALHNRFRFLSYGDSSLLFAR